MDIENLKEINTTLNMIKVKDIMSRFAITTTRETSVTDLAHLLMRFKISGVPVVNSNKEIIGIVTATDLFEVMRNIIEKIKDESEQRVGEKVFVKDIMTTKVFFASKDASLFEALKLMCDKNIHTLPVVSGKEIIGVIGRRDVINAFYAKENQVSPKR
ncbi:MAG: CBS domain-containing protein [Candidatus Omnitrophica bacterium]|nr:CBS domain-containing protein [Candidatus Omnitrophota bacterium]MBU1996005.1 CBS domain-containing protein [Candidatus Omnitrophota bacterium]MBU4334489.1 CBS domain-containing protein [Candidatus Omnitrophota bacterium]